MDRPYDASCTVDATLLDSDKPYKGFDDPDIKRYYYKPHELQKFKSDPEFLLNYRKKIKYAIN
jgi:hypothetical protein